MASHLQHLLAALLWNVSIRHDHVDRAPVVVVAVLVVRMMRARDGVIHAVDHALPCVTHDFSEFTPHSSLTGASVAGG
jgi:hypothetical protein